ncbi:MAG: AAA family ATPase [Rhodoferax sp.]|uniref:AAA family ATPase n=1 Tax=Rhodoferax sp. TaxID=50421 RepID=UPI001B5C88C0|nr:MoxR family ATPase [Rhodoferax sp.]MBP9684409.1 AAA family ATPase [Rhodoferax sp.]MBP9906532.1 AAA family ATPase [Rhodoferax sp.]
MRPAQLTALLEREFLSTAEGHHTPVMLWGPPGVGKSQIVAQIGRRHQVPVIDIRLSQMEPSDLRGIPFRVGDLVQWAVPAMLPDAQRHGPHGVLFLDEITSAPPAVSAAAYQLILDRRLGDYHIPDGWVIFAAGNRQGDRGVTYAMPAPLANRFSHFEVVVNLDDWVVWAYASGIDERLIAFLRFKPELLFAFDAARTLAGEMAFPSPRSWEFAHRALQKFDQTPDLLTAALCACVGHAAGVECAAFIDSLERLPDLDAIVAGQEVAVPTELDLQYAVAAALAGRALRAKGQVQSKQVWGHILNYAQRLPLKEMGVMLVSDMHRGIGSALFAVPEFAGWAHAVADLVLYE